MVSKSNPACSSVLLLVCVFADWLNWGTLEVTHCIITVLSFYLITTDHYYINELLINYWISIISWSFMHNYIELQLWTMLQMNLSVCVWVQVHVCVLIRTVGKEQLSTLRLSSSLFHTAVLTTQRERENVTFRPCQLDYIKKYHSSRSACVWVYTYIHTYTNAPPQTQPVCEMWLVLELPTWHPNREQHATTHSSSDTHTVSLKYTSYTANIHTNTYSEDS